MASLLLVAACGKKAPGTDPLAAQERAFQAYIENLPALTPIDPKTSHTIEVLYLEDEHLPAPPPLETLFKRTQTLALEYLGLKVDFKLVGRMEISRYFEQNQDHFQHPVTSYPIQAWHLNFADPKLSEKIEPAIERLLRSHEVEILEQYFGPIGKNEKDYIRKISDAFLRKNRAIYGEKNLAGQALQNVPANARQTAFAYWDALLFQEKQADFLLTNTLLAAPDRTMPLYVVNRGGITSGFVENNEYRPYQGVGMLALYPFLSQGPFFAAARGPYTAEETLDAIAFLWLHELGHLLLRKQENYSLVGSIHRAPIDLDYRAWVESIKKHHKEIKESVPELKKF